MTMKAADPKSTPVVLPLSLYEFAVVSGLRAHQLMAGSVARMPGDHKKTTIARMEVAAGQVRAVVNADPLPAPLAGLELAGVASTFEP